MQSWGLRASWDCLNTVQVPFRPRRKLREQHLLLPSVWCCLESFPWLPPSLPALRHQPDLSGAHLPKPNVRMIPICPLMDFAVTLTPSPAQSAPPRVLVLLPTMSAEVSAHSPYQVFSAVLSGSCAWALTIPSQSQILHRTYIPDAFTEPPLLSIFSTPESSSSI